MATRKQTEPDNAHTSTQSKSQRPRVRSAASASRRSSARASKGSASHASGNAQGNSSSFLGLLKELFAKAVPGHENEFLFAGIGFIAALILLFIGFWQFMLILLFVVAGVMFGQYLDGEPKVLNALKEWIASIRKD